MQNITAIALSRMTAQQRELDVIANNIANASTPGFRAERMQFSTWLDSQPGSGANVESSLAFAQDHATYRVQVEGAIRQTGNPLDLAIGTDGFFTVNTPNGPRLTRAGNFSLAADGTITDSAGNALLDTAGQPLHTGPADIGLHVAGDGTISSQNGRLGKIGVVVPQDAGQLSAEGGTLFDASATPTTALATPQIVQGALEGSNVQPILETTSMMNQLREFQFVSQFLQNETTRQQSSIDKILKPQS